MHLWFGVYCFNQSMTWTTQLSYNRHNYMRPGWLGIVTVVDVSSMWSPYLVIGPEARDPTSIASSLKSTMFIILNDLIGNFIFYDYYMPFPYNPKSNLQQEPCYLYEKKNPICNHHPFLIASIFELWATEFTYMNPQ